MTLRDVLVKSLPLWPGVFNGREGGAGGGGAGAGATSAGGAGVGEPIVVVQGIKPALETPALWLCQQLASADNILHVVLLPRGEGDAESGAS